MDSTGFYEDQSAWWYISRILGVFLWAWLMLWMMDSKWFKKWVHSGMWRNRHKWK